VTSTVIVGLGLSGLGCALELARSNIAFTGYERDPRPGGLAKTDSVGGFAFDHGPHVLLDLPAELSDLLDALPTLDLAEHRGQSCIAIGPGLRHLVPVPFQRNLNHLPWLERARVFCDLATRRRAAPPRNYRDFASQRCGQRAFALFLQGYEAKRLRFDLDAIPPDWTRRVERPSLWSPLLPRTRPGKANAIPRDSRFRYARSGGIETLPRAMTALLPTGSLRCGHELVEINLRARRLRFAQGRSVRYQTLVLSLPLPQIISLIHDPPAAIRDAARNLIWTSIYVVSLGIAGPVSGLSFIRFPAADVPFYRLSFPSVYAPGSAPAGAGSVVMEVAHHPDRHALSGAQAIRQCCEALVQLGLLGRTEQPRAEHLHNIRYGTSSITATRTAACAFSWTGWNSTGW
jgi:protoporphyrinogen oxidase